MIEARDFSHHDEVDLRQFKAQGMIHFWQKVTEGSNFLDSTYARIGYARGIGFNVGAYHYFKCSHDAKEQAEWFHDYYKPLKGDLWPMLDLEEIKGMTAVEYRESVDAFIQEYEALTGLKIGIYSYPDFLKSYLGEGYGDHKLWYASYPNLHTPAGYKVSVHQYAGGQGGTSHDKDRILVPIHEITVP